MSHNLSDVSLPIVTKFCHVFIGGRDWDKFDQKSPSQKNTLAPKRQNFGAILENSATYLVGRTFNDLRKYCSSSNISNNDDSDTNMSQRINISRGVLGTFDGSPANPWLIQS